MREALVLRRGSCKFVFMCNHNSSKISTTCLYSLTFFRPGFLTLRNKVSCKFNYSNKHTLILETHCD